MVQIITDSSADFEPAELEKMGVQCVSLQVIFGDREYKENIDITKDEFYNMLENSNISPKTSQPSPADFIDAYKKAKTAGDEVVGIFLSSHLSGTYQGAQLAKTMEDFDDCYLVDGLTATAGTRILIEYAVSLRDSGFSAAAIADKINQIKEKVMIVASLDTLEYLRRGGRISETAALIGTAAHIKPIIRIAGDGKVAIPSKAIGLKRGIKYILKQFLTCGVNDEFPFYILYTHRKENALELAKSFKENGILVPDENILNIGAVIGTHVGPGAFGVAFVSK